jgi:sarcosine oxidase subunit delta
MQLFTCPFCGERDETEFHFGAEAGKTRPEPAAEVSPARWAEYLYGKANPKGATREIWVHSTCGAFFLMERDTVTHAVTASTALGRAE